MHHEEQSYRNQDDYRRLNWQFLWQFHSVNTVPDLTERADMETRRFTDRIDVVCEREIAVNQDSKIPNARGQLQWLVVQ